MASRDRPGTRVSPVLAVAEYCAGVLVIVVAAYVVAVIARVAFDAYLPGTALVAVLTGDEQAAAEIIQHGANVLYAVVLGNWTAVLYDAVRRIPEARGTPNALVVVGILAALWATYASADVMAYLVPALPQLVADAPILSMLIVFVVHAAVVGAVVAAAGLLFRRPLQVDAK